MERNYRLASVLGGAAGIAAVVLLATLAIAGPRLGFFLGGGGYLRPHQAAQAPVNDDSLDDHRGDSGCKNSCGAAPVHSSADTFGDSLPVLGDFDQSTAMKLASDDGDTHRLFQDGPDPPFFGNNFGGGGSGSHGAGYPPIFTGVGGRPPTFPGNPPPKPPGGGKIPPPPGGGTTPPGGGSEPPGGGTTPPGGGPTPPGGGSVPGVPEPAAWALFMIGAGAIGAALRASRPR